MLKKKKYFFINPDFHPYIRILVTKIIYLRGRAKKIANAEGIAYLRGLKLSYHGKEINNNQKLA